MATRARLRGRSGFSGVLDPAKEMNQQSAIEKYVSTRFSLSLNIWRGLSSRVTALTAYR